MSLPADAFIAFIAFMSGNIARRTGDRTRTPAVARFQTAGASNANRPHLRTTSGRPRLRGRGAEEGVVRR